MCRIRFNTRSTEICSVRYLSSTTIPISLSPTPFPGKQLLLLIGYWKAFNKTPTRDMLSHRAFLPLVSRALVSHGTLDVNNSTNDLPLVQLHQITEQFKIHVNKSRRLRNALHQKVFPACNPRRCCIGCHCPPQPHSTVSEPGST